MTASQISVHRRDNSKKKKKRVWCFSVCGIIFHCCPHRLCVGHGSATQLTVLILRRAQFYNAFQRERAGQTEKQRSNWQTCRDNNEQRHQYVAAEIACSNTSSSESQISLWKVFFPLSSLTVLYFTKWLFVKPFIEPKPFFLCLPISVQFQYYFQQVWGLMGAEKGNYTASDLCMIVGFGLWLRVGGRIAETSHREVALVYGHKQETTKWGHQLSIRHRTEPVATLCTCRTGELPVSASPTGSPAWIITASEHPCIFAGSEFPRLCSRWGEQEGNFPLSARIYLMTVCWKGITSSPL